jgi:TRAP-type uncharacterized transport system fused permease subunit
MVRPGPGRVRAWTNGAGKVLASRKEGKMIQRIRRRFRGDAGMNTAEYAVGTIAAVAFAGILLKVLTSSAVQSALSAIIQRARS